MSKDKDNQKFIDAVSKDIKQSVDELDASILSKLTQLRSQALVSKSSVMRQWWYLPAGAIATACLAILIYGVAINPDIEQITTEDDIDLISTSDSLELYEDLEFYEWLEDYAA